MSKQNKRKSCGSFFNLKYIFNTLKTMNEENGSEKYTDLLDEYDFPISKFKQLKILRETEHWE